MPIHLTIQGLNEFTGDVNEAVHSEMPKQIRWAMVQSVNAVKNTAQRMIAYDTGTLRRSIFTDVSDSGVKGIVAQDLSIAPYGRYVNDGTGIYVGHSRYKGNIPGVGWRWIKGMKGRPFMQPALENNLDTISNYFSQAIKQVVLKMAGKA